MRHSPPIWLLAPVLPLLVVALIAPLVWLFVTALLSPEPWSVDSFFWHVLRFTYLQAAISASLSVALGGVGAWLLVERAPARWAEAVQRFSSLPFALPAIVVALAIADFWGAYGWAGILLAHVFYNFPLALKYVGGALREMDRSAEKAALSLGAGRWRTFREVSLPKLRPALATSFVLAFLYCAGSFVVVLMLGGGPRFTTLEIAIYQSIRAEFQVVAGARLALIQFGIATLFHWLVHRQPAVPTRGDFVALYGGARTRPALAAFLIVWTLLVPGPLLLLVGRAATGLAVVDWREIGEAAWTSARLGLLSSAVAIAIALPLAGIARGRWRATIGRLANLPLFLSPLVLSLAWMVLYPDLLWRWRGSLGAIALAQGLVSVPLAFGPLTDAWARVPTRLLESAATLGAGPVRRFFWIELPLLRRSFRTALLFTSALSFGELSAVLVFADGDVSTLALLGYRYMARYRFQEAAVVSAVLLLTVAALHFSVGEKRAEHAA